MNLMIFEALSADRLKRAQAHIERDFGDFDAPVFQAVQNFGGEMQTRGWRGDGASLPGINGLVTFAIHRLVARLI